VTHRVIVMLTTVADDEAARTLVAGVLDARLAACATCLAPARSTYHWEGRIESASEVPVLFKTVPERADALERWLSEHHPYDVPEILRWDADAAPAYALWASAETAVQS
jgi:periplasmic divalent cation tolerance protein